MINLALILSFFLTTGNPPLRETGILHDFKLSVCEIIRQEGTDILELKFYLFQDDFKMALYGNPNDARLEQKAANDYILEHFSLRINEEQTPLSFHSMQTKNDQVLIQFNSGKIVLKNVAKIEVRNKLLIEKFKEQINMVYAVLPGRSKMTQMLNAAKTEAVFTL